ncbi:site-specific integrase [Nocardia fluminea]|uniref:Phage integrase family protein n=1 Tax=Nocardia fluminea TaxID=134984 RepID=A0A2N3WYH6_9NOCA|nr:tyrosine-type recombinase/integrase [Nocardia fluminea]PKV98914.1 phage integrase family protein [Nocardia fluminea]
MEQNKRGRPGLDPGTVPEPNLKPHPGQPGVWTASGRPRDWNGNYRRITRSSPPDTDSRGRTKPDRTGERARRAFLDAAQEWIDSSVTLAGALNKRSTLSQLWAAYKGDLRKRGRLEETIYNYEPMMRDTVIPKYGHREIATINTAVIEDMLDYVGRERGGSAPRILKENILSGMFRFGIRVGALPSGNPVREALLQKPSNFSRRRGGAAFVDSATVERLLIGVYTSTAPCPTLETRMCKTARKVRVPTVAQYCDTYDMADWVLFVAATGWRLGQTLGVCESDIDFDTGIVTPRGAVRARDGSAQVWTDYTADHAEEDLNQAKFITKPVQLPQVVLDMVRVRIKRLKKTRLALPPRPDDADWPQDLLFFDLDDGGPRNLKSMSRRWRRLAAALGLPEGVTPHSLRKHLGTEGISAGLDATKVADQLGNTSRVLRKSYVRRHQPHADVTALIGDKLGPALAEIGRRRSG